MAEPNYRAAAARHLRDAHVLHGQSRPAGAAYLSGYSVECALKALLEHGGQVPPFVHDLQHLRRAVLNLAGARRGRSLTAIVRLPFSLPFQYGEPGSGQVQHWHEALRYQPDEAISSELSGEWSGAAGTFYARTIGRLGRHGA